MELLLGLAKEGFFAVLFVIAALVNIYQYKLNQKLQEKRVEDWQTVLNTTNDLAKVTQKSQETTAIMVQGIDTSMKIILDRLEKHV